MKKSAPSIGRLHQALLDQPLLQNRKEIATWLIAKRLKPEILGSGKCLVAEGDAQNKDVYFILQGKVRIEIGGHIIAYREKTHVGEMAFVMEEARTASVFAETDVEIVRVPEDTMRLVCDKFPVIWKSMARTLCDRLNQRRAIFRAANLTPRIFIGSSSASKKIVEALKDEMEKKLGATVQIRPWTGANIFAPSAITIEALIEEAKGADFGVFVLAADDKLSHRRSESKVSRTNKVVPRDNVIFEGGMFVAACGLKRTFFLCEKHSSLHIPTDLAGVTFLRFSRLKKGGGIDFGGEIDKIVAAVRDMGVITGRTTSQK